MGRIQMIGSRRLVIVALVALLFIGVTVDADHTAASFTATTDNPGNQFVTAHLALSNDNAPARALVNASKLVPGDTMARTVTPPTTALRLPDAVGPGGSRPRALPVGALLLTEPVGPASITVGDVITFTLPDRLITHRVIAIAHDDAGLQFVTKGDANDAADPVPIRAGAAVGAVRLSVPPAGYALAELPGWWRVVAAVIVCGIALDAARPRVARSRLAPAGA